MKNGRQRYHSKSKGYVSLIGAGPGDPELLTLRAKDALGTCDVVIYDHLVSPKILDYAPTARHIYAGKRGGDPDSARQSSIESLMVRLARSGKRVVRLKGGDPFVFGRGGEEALYLAHHRIPFEIVPGVTAGVGVPAYAGIPVTHRGLASEVTFLTAHEDPSKKDSDINWKAIAELKGTLVLYMGVRTLPQVIRTLTRYGKKVDTPVSVIQWGTRAGQKVVTGTLKTIVGQVKKAGIVAPALTVIGSVNRLRKQLIWFEKKPLFGKTVLVTRSRNQASSLSKMLERNGASVIELPTIRISPIEDFKLLDQAICQVERYDWLVFTSENGVEVFFDRLRQLRKDSRRLAGVKIAAIGPGTRAKLNSYFVEPDLVPSSFSSEGLLEAFLKEEVSGKRFLLLRTNIAPDFLKRGLERTGAKVTEIAVYRTERPEGLAEKIRQLFRHYSVDFITFTSSSTAEYFFKALPNGRKVRAKLVSIGPVTSETVRKLGGSVYREAKIHTISGLVDTILKVGKKS